MGKDLIIVVGFENICRLCLHSTDAMSDIFPSSGKTSLQQQIFYITGLATKKGDGLPSKICYRCRHIVELACELRDVVEKSQKILAKTVSNCSHSDPIFVREVESEPFDNETFLQSLNDTNDRIERTMKEDRKRRRAEQNSPEQKYCKPSSPEPQYSELNSPEPQYSELNSPEPQNSEQNSEEEQHSGTNSPQAHYNQLNTIFLPDHVDHTTEITAEEVEDLDLPSKKESKTPTCKLCNKQFASSKELRPHVLQHYAKSENLQMYLDIKCGPYLCTVCDEVQANKARLLVHHRKHLGINPCRCHVPGCQYVGANASLLRRHRSVHDVRRRQCDLCRRTFYRRDLLLRHLARAHPDDHKHKAPATNTTKQVVTEIEPYRVGSRWFTRNDGHFYVIYRQRDATSSLRCHREGCPARFIIKRAHSGPVSEEHNHPPTPWIPSRNSMFQALKRRATEETTALRTIYKEELARYPAAAPHVPFATVASSMRKWRRAARPDHDPWGTHLQVDAPSKDHSTEWVNT